MNDLKNYKNYVISRISKIMPFLQKYAFGDFSDPIPVPDEEDEFTELLVSINLMREDLADMVKELEQKQRSLSNTNDRLKVLFDFAGAGLSIENKDGDLQKINHRFCEILGYENEADLIGMNYLEFTHPEDRELSKEFGDKMEAGIVDSVKENKRYLRKDGTPVWVSLYSSPIKDDRGQIKEYFTAIQDITDTMETQEKLTQLVDKLESSKQQLEHFNTQLKSKNTELEQFNQVAVDRELRMIEMKKTINQLHKELGREAPYDMSFITVAEES